MITEPGVHNIPTADYLADPVEGGSLTASGARKLLPPYCPAIFAYDRAHPREATHVFDIGHAAHRFVLGDGPNIVAIDANDWRTNAAKEAREAARSVGCVPLLRADYDRTRAMAEALLANPTAAALFKPGSGKAEQTLVWRDEPSEVWRRRLLDWLPEQNGSRMILPDYKTARSANPDSFARSAGDYGYHQDAAWSLDGVKTLGLDDDPAFVFVVQEKEPPYLSSVVELDAPALRIGRLLNRQAIDLYAACSARDYWPGYSSEVELISLPPWIENRFALEAL